MSVVRIDLEVNEKGATETVTRLGGTIKGLGPTAATAGAAMGAGFAVAQKALELVVDAARALPAEIERVVSKAAGFADLAAKLDMSASSAQKLSYMGSLVGVSMESMSTASLKLQKNLAQHPELFKKWGLSAQALRDSKPEEQFVAISEAIRGLGDRELQVAAITDLMGRGGAENLGLFRQNLADLNAEADNLHVAMGDELIGKLDSVDDASTRLSKTWEGLKDQIIGQVVAASGADEVLNNLAKAIGGVNGAASNNGGIAAWVAIVERLTGLDQIKSAIQILSLLNEGSPAPKGLPKSGGPAQIDFAGIDSRAMKAAEEQSKEYEKNQKEAKKREEEIERLAADTMTKIRVDAIKAVNAQVEGEYHRNVKIIGYMLDDWVAEEKAAADAIKAAREQLKQDGQEFMDSWAKQQQKEHDDFVAKWTDVERFGQAIQDLGNAFGGTGGGAIAGIGSFVSQLGASMLQVEQATNKYQLLAMAISGVANAYATGKASGSPGKGALKGALGGAATGAAIGSVIPGLGTVAGGVIGGAIGGIAGWFGGKSGQKEALADLGAQFATLMAQAHAAGVVFSHTFDPKTATQFKAAIDEVKHALDVNAQAQEKLNDALGRYHFTEQELGPTLRNQHLEEQAAQLYQDWELLNAAGLDHQAIVREMGPGMSDYVNASKAAGQEIPSAMKPAIDAMIEQGTLLDENGNAYTSAEAAGISYAETMSQMFTDMIKAVRDLVDALNGVPKDITTTHHLNTEVGGEGGAGAGTTGRPAGVAPGPGGLGGRSGGAGHTFSFNMSGMQVNGANSREIADGIAEQLERRTAPRLAAAMKRNVLA